MRSQDQHLACVDAWLKRTAAKDLSNEALLRLFEAALGALWGRTVTPLGEVTVTAIAGRVLHNASDKIRVFSSLRVEPSSGIQWQGLRDRIGSVPSAELRRGIRFVLVEFLSVLGNLTAEILTADLHSLLSGIALPKAARLEKRGAATPPSPHRASREDLKS